MGCKSGCGIQSFLRGANQNTTTFSLVSTKQSRISNPSASDPSAAAVAQQQEHGPFETSPMPTNKNKDHSKRTYALAAAVVPQIAEAAHLGIPPHSHLQNIPVGGFPSWWRTRGRIRLRVDAGAKMQHKMELVTAEMARMLFTNVKTKYGSTRGPFQDPVPPIVF